MPINKYSTTKKAVSTETALINKFSLEIIRAAHIFNQHCNKCCKCCTKDKAKNNHNYTKNQICLEERLFTLVNSASKRPYKWHNKVYNWNKH